MKIIIFLCKSLNNNFMPSGQEVEINQTRKEQKNMNKKILISTISGTVALAAGVIGLKIYHQRQLKHNRFLGYMDGYDEGYNVGYDAGYDDGYVDCANSEGRES